LPKLIFKIKMDERINIKVGGGEKAKGGRVKLLEVLFGFKRAKAKDG
jgi:hypothetical protein